MRLIHTRSVQSFLRKQCRTEHHRTLSQYSERKNKQNDNANNSIKKTSWFTASVATGIFTYYLLQEKGKRVLTEEKRTSSSTEAGAFRPGLPSYSMKEVSKHSTMESKIWITYKEGVYDITSFVQEHPGGEQILMAAGSSVEPFWMLYAVHKNEHVYELLETLRIGNLKKEDQVAVTDLDDPYGNEPLRHSSLIAANKTPFNAEPPLSLLCASFITPNELFYVRNHLPVPRVDPETYELEIEVEGTQRSVCFSLEELKKFPKVSVTATIMCAGNRRSDMVKIKPVKGLNWGPCAIGNAVWTGVRLSDLLKQVGITEDEEHFKHVQFEGLDLDATATQYGASIPIWKAVDTRGDVILAYEMNGTPLPPDHGYPLRVVVPGVVGARNVKWLGKILVSEKESPSHWQQNDYKGFSPSTDWDNADFTKSPAIQQLPVISAICSPAEGDTVQLDKGFVTVKGYAWSGGGQKIVRVDVTTDKCRTWHVADLTDRASDEPPRHWSWTLWSVRIPVDKAVKEMEIWCKAVDSCYNTQPESVEHIWNFRGVLSNAYHRVKVKLDQ